MYLEPKPPTSSGPADRFTGDVWVDAIAEPKEGDQRMIVSRVRFAPGSRTAWHSHARGQTLHVTEGVALDRHPRRERSSTACPGDTIYTRLRARSTGTVSTPQDFMEHLAMLENGVTTLATTTRWLEHVDDAQYGAV